jgi:hypothetical protein
MTTEPLFWCVWSEGGGSPTVKHASFTKAKSEAQRLARANPGRRFVVLAAALAYVKDDLRETRFGQDEHPHWCACPVCAPEDDQIPF